MQQILIQQLMAEYQKQSFQQVIELFNQYFSIKQCDPNVGMCFANALRHTGDVKAASKAFEQLLKRFKNVPQIFNSHANLLIASGQLVLAKRQLKNAIGVDPYFADAYVNLGRLESIQQHFSNAIANYKKAAELRPQDINASIGLAESYKNNQQEEQAERIYQALMSTAQGRQNYRVLLNLSSLLRNKGQYNDAIALLNEAVNLYPQAALIYSMLAANYALLKDIVQATQYYKKALSVEPGNTQIQLEFAHFSWAQGFENPFAEIINAITNPLQQSDLCLACLNLLLNAEQFDLVKLVLDKCLPALDSLALINMFAARYYRLTGDIATAGTYIKKSVALSTKPVDVSVENERGYIALATGDYKTALSLYQSLQRREPDNQGWWTLYSTALKLAGKQKIYGQLCDYCLVHSANIMRDKDASFMPELIAKLEEVHANINHPIGQSLRNGTQTYEDIFDDKTPVIQTLKRWIHQQATTFTKALEPNKHHPFLCKVGGDIDFTGSWSVCLRNGGFHTSHFHPQGWLSGVIYIDVPPAVELGGEGWLQYGVPEIDQLDLPADYVVKPSQGTVVFFPSFMWHGTRPFASGDRRMTIAFDMVPV